LGTIWTVVVALAAGYVGDILGGVEGGLIGTFVGCVVGTGLFIAWMKWRAGK
jgi:hypothetical protein